MREKIKTRREFFNVFICPTTPQQLSFFRECFQPFPSTFLIFNLAKMGAKSVDVKFNWAAGAGSITKLFNYIIKPINKKQFAS